jgi:type IV pilus assembly protein PilC
MPRFNYVALDSRGQEATGLVEATSTNDAIGRLRQAGYFPTSVYEEAVALSDGKDARRRTAKMARMTKPRAKSSIVLLQRTKVKPKILMIFTRQLATLIDSGLPLLRSLTVLAKQERDKVLKKTINKLADSVQSGNTFSDALALHPRIFNNLYVNMVYPIIVMTMAVGIMAFLLVFIVPKFEAIFHDMLGDKPLPAVTTFVIGTSSLVKDHGLVLLGGIIVTVMAYKFIGRTRGGRFVIDSFKLRMPLFGDLNRKTAISRFARTLGTLVTSGVPILQALNITRETAGNAAIAAAISQVHDSVKEGESIVQPLETSRAFPPMVISMIDVGEETGKLPDMLLKIADVYDDEVDNSVAALTSMLEPIMIVFLALIVGTIVLALFTPLISIITGLQQQT